MPKRKGYGTGRSKFVPKKIKNTKKPNMTLSKDEFASVNIGRQGSTSSYKQYLEKAKKRNKNK